MLIYYRFITKSVYYFSFLRSLDDGNRHINLLPTPILLSILSLPSCLIRTRFTIARPRPMPPSFRLLPRLTLKNLSVNLGISDSITPSPVSSTESRHPDSILVQIIFIYPSSDVCLTALLNRFVNKDSSSNGLPIR